MKSFSLLGLYLLSFQLFAVNEKDDFVYDLSLATQGVSVSQYNTGVNYSIGRGITKDLEKAIYWYQRASEQGHSKAPFNIAIFYSDGAYVDPDPELALNYFLIAEERGNLSAKKFLDALRLNKDIRMQDALVELCCPDPLSHSMIKN
tara:strand:+ start:13040 stop:13480 length:441 start_codon:yes stop_codon:yes gene_type:complete